YSPAITWARKADRLAFTYYENGDYTIWSIANPRALKKLPYRDKAVDKAPLIVADNPAANDASAPMPALGNPHTGHASVYRSSAGELRSSADLPSPSEHGAKPPVSIK